MNPIQPARKTAREIARKTPGGRAQPVDRKNPPLPPLKGGEGFPVGGRLVPGKLDRIEVGCA